MRYDDATQKPDARGPARDRERQRVKRIGLVGTLLSLLALIALIWLFGPGDDSGSKVETQGLQQVDGTLVVVEQDRLVLRAFEPIDGQTEIEFTIREQDVGNFDIAHMQSHSAVALPTRIFYEEDGGTHYAVYKEDAPANSAQQ